eukprot:TRINITY_DN19786_c0_g1_i1.p1 TRINITY_DN19786_c0_g1~~TRINITY_DN19786_c0_g1_i1.p1  ORF type:complete len:163 (-),score=44.91 TRINITY_DN19786_c0_g1_i1:27-515(-)
MTRSVGDTVLSEYGVEPRPDVTYTRLQANDSFLVLASDGVWEFLPSQEVADFVGRLRREGVAPKEAADALVRESVRRWRRNEVVVDDTTAVIVYLDAAGGPAAPAGPPAAPSEEWGSRGQGEDLDLAARGRRLPNSSARARRRRHAAAARRRGGQAHRLSPH